MQRNVRILTQVPVERQLTKYDHIETQVNTCLAIFTKAITSDSEETDGEYFKHNNALKDIERISDKQ